MNLDRHQPSGLNSPPADVSARTFDVGELLREKNPGLHRRVPGPVLNLISRLLYCDYINRELHAMHKLPCRQFPQAALDHLGVDFNIEGRRPDSSITRPVFLANHPLGGLDGLAMLSWMLNRYDEVKVPANDILAKFPHLRPMVTPVDRFNSQRNLAKTLHDTFGSSAAVLVFPAGRTSRPAIVGGRLSDYPWQKMAVRMARIHQRPLVPVFISGRNSRLFYAIFHLRRWLGVRTNLEMLLLVREMMRPTTRRICLHFGQAIQPAELDGLGNDDQERMQWVRAACYRLESTNADIQMPSHQPQTRLPE